MAAKKSSPTTTTPKPAASTAGVKTGAKPKTTAKATATVASNPTAKPAPKPAAKATAKNAPAAKAPAKKVVAKSGAAKTVATKAPETKSTRTKKAAAQQSAPLTNAIKAKTPAKQTVTFRVKRGSLVNGAIQQRDQEFQVAYDVSTTVLQGLEQIKADQDGTLTFRRSCRASICGSCGMFINNRSRLACKTKIQDLVLGNPDKNIAAIGPDGVIEVGPQKNQPVLKDLVVDIQPFYDKVAGITPYVQDGAETQTNVGKDAFDQVNLVSNCIMCGACYSDCTAMVENPSFIGPAALAKAYRFVSDPREGHKTERLQDLSEKNGIWDCTRCGMCIDACPKDVAPMEAIVKLRTLAIDAGVTNNRGAKHAMVFKDDIENWGVLNEPFMLLKTVGITGLIQQLPNALNLAKKGKIPNPFPYDHKVEKLHEISAIYEELEKSPIDVATKSDASGPGAG